MIINLKNTGKVLLLVIFIASRLQTYGQTWDEWFRQSKTQKKYLLEQIAALKVYTNYAAKGYRIVKNGLSIIADIKNGDYSLHSNFFASLKQVNPAIAGTGKIAVITRLELMIYKQAKSLPAYIQQTGQFTAVEMSYCQGVYVKLLSDCLQGIEHLFMVISPGNVAMTDDQRIREIDRLYDDMQNRYAFCIDFSNDCKLLAVQRLKDQMEQNQIKQLTGLP